MSEGEGATRTRKERLEIGTERVTLAHKQVKDAQEPAYRTTKQTPAPRSLMHNAEDRERKEKGSRRCREAPSIVGFPMSNCNHACASSRKPSSEIPGLIARL